MTRTNMAVDGTDRQSTPRPLLSLLLTLGIGVLLGVSCTSSGADSSLQPTEIPNDLLSDTVKVEAPNPILPTPSPWQTPSEVADSPEGVIEQLTKATLRLSDPAATGPELAWMGQLEQAVYRKLVERPEWRSQVIDGLPEDLRAVATLNVKAGVELRGMISPGDSLPNWNIVEPPPLEELLAYYQLAEAEFGVPWPYLAAVHLVETVMGRIRGTSVAGAQGPMQFMPATWAAYGEGDINNPRDAIRAAARYLRAGGAPNNMARALYSYNPSQRYVQAVGAYAQVMLRYPNAYRGYYHWQVYYLTTTGDKMLPVGYGRD
jgi:hypothetical protein